MSMKANLNCSIVIGSWTIMGNTIHQAKIPEWYKKEAESKQASTHVLILFSLLCMWKAPTLTFPVQHWPVAEFQAK